MKIRLYEIDYVFVHPDPNRNQNGSVFVWEDASLDEDPALKELKESFKAEMDEAYQEYRNSGNVDQFMKDYGIDGSLLDQDGTPEEALYSGFAKWLVEDQDFEYATPEKIDTNFAEDENGCDKDDCDDCDEDDDDDDS